MPGHDQRVSGRWLGVLLVLASGCCWGFHGILIKYALSLGASFMQVFFVEVLLAACFFGLLHRRFFNPVRPHGWGQWSKLLAIGCATVGVGTFLFLAFSLGPVAIAATFMFLYLPVVYAFSVLTGRQRIHAVKAVAICLIILGAVMTTQVLSTFDQPGVIPAILAATAASVAYAVVFLLTPSVAAYTTLAFRSFAVSGIGLAGSLAIILSLPQLWQPLQGNVLQFAVLAVVLSLVGQMLPVITLMQGLPLTGSRLGVVLASVELPIAVFSSAILLGESLTFPKVLGVALVLSGIVAYNFAERFHPIPHLAHLKP